MDGWTRKTEWRSPEGGGQSEQRRGKGEKSMLMRHLTLEGGHNAISRLCVLELLA